MSRIDIDVTSIVDFVMEVLSPVFCSISVYVSLCNNPTSTVRIMSIIKLTWLKMKMPESSVRPVKCTIEFNNEEEEMQKLYKMLML